MADPIKQKQSKPDAGTAPDPVVEVHDGAVTALETRVAALEATLAERDAALAAAGQCWERAVDWIARLSARLTLAELSDARRMSVRLDEKPRHPNTTVATYDTVYEMTKQELQRL